jgi:transcriptional regulator with XRE-family HTH domain
MARKPNPRGRMPNGKAHPIDIHLGQRIRLRRTELGMSQQKLGEAIGLTFQQVQKYECGANRMGGSRLWQMSRVLSVPVNWFFEQMPADLHNARNVVALAKVEVRDLEQGRESLEAVRAYNDIPTPELRMVARKTLRALAAAGGSVTFKRKHA